MAVSLCYKTCNKVNFKLGLGMISFVFMQEPTVLRQLHRVSINERKINEFYGDERTEIVTPDVRKKQQVNC